MVLHLFYCIVSPASFPSSSFSYDEFDTFFFPVALPRRLFQPFGEKVLISKVASLGNNVSARVFWLTLVGLSLPSFLSKQFIFGDKTNQPPALVVTCDAGNSLLLQYTVGDKCS